jgi:hypothetical protein
LSQDNQSQSSGSAPDPDAQPQGTQPQDAQTQGSAQDSQSQANPDIRQQVDDSRGFQKKLELLVPGLRGYRTQEDIRVSDDMLRNQVADKLDQTKSNLEDLRKQMVTAGDFTNLTPVGTVIFQIQQISGQVRHAQQGYSGFVANISINTQRLNKLYEYDYDFVNSAVQLVTQTSMQNLRYDPTAPGNIQTKISTISSMVYDFKQKWAVRMEAIENILVK